MEELGTEYCTNCILLKEKTRQLKIWENTLEKREAELDQEIQFIRENKIY